MGQPISIISKNDEHNVKTYKEIYENKYTMLSSTEKTKLLDAIIAKKSHCTIVNISKGGGCVRAELEYGKTSYFMGRDGFEEYHSTDTCEISVYTDDEMRAKDLSRAAERFLSEGRLTEALNNFSEAYRLSRNPNNYREYKRKRDETNRQQESNTASAALRGEGHFGAYRLSLLMGALILKSLDRIVKGKFVY